MSNKGQKRPKQNRLQKTPIPPQQKSVPRREAITNVSTQTTCRANTRARLTAPKPFTVDPDDETNPRHYENEARKEARKVYRQRNSERVNAVGRRSTHSAIKTAFQQVKASLAPNERPSVKEWISRIQGEEDIFEDARFAKPSENTIRLVIKPLLNSLPNTRRPLRRKRSAPRR